MLNPESSQILRPPLRPAPIRIPVNLASSIAFCEIPLSFSSQNSGTGTVIQEFFDNMPSTATCEKTQPWRAHWPAPAKNGEGIEYGVQKGEIIVVDGTSAKVSPAKNDDTGGAADKQTK